MGGQFPASNSEIGLSLERSGNHFTIRSANLALNKARLECRSEDIAEALIRLAHLHFRQGRYSRTRILAEEVLRDAPADSLVRCDALRILGNCAAELGDPDGAESHYFQSIDLARQLDYHYALYKCLHSLATNIYWPRGQFDLCLAAGKEALTQAQALGLGEELWFPLSDIAWVYWSTGQLVAANAVADQMEAVVSPGSLGDGFYCCLRAGLVEPGEGLLAAVLPLYDRARTIAEATGDPGLSVEVRLGLCRCHRAAKDLPAALAWAEDAVNVCVRMNYRQFQGLALIERARVRMDQGDLAGAEMDLGGALEIASQLRSKFDLARASLYRAAVLSAQTRPESGAAWQQAARLVMENGYGFLIEQERSIVLSWIAETLNASDLNVSQTSAALLEHLLRLSPARLQVKTFGQFAIQVGTNLVSKENLRQRRAGELLALLLSSPGFSLSAEQVTEAMCPEKEPGAAVDFYHHAISTLRRLLEPDLPDRRFACRYLDVSEERVILIVPPGSSIDFLEFDQHIRNRAWEKAATIYQGEYLPMYCYAEWTLPLRQHYADQYEQALLVLAGERFEAGAAETCLDLVRRVLVQNAWQEKAVAIGMRAALQLGDRVTALKLYRRLEKKLEEELGIAPQPELQELYKICQKRTG